ncbi:hypothetical protein [Capillimicrobium parvum]|uniref:hypothetical protein n=1 Tax=Capillimicrobium parvum TaxID=2884022 RepID=UPI00216B1863|nr:hypothetical protein [Capillimicrobium parvum]
MLKPDVEILVPKLCQNRPEYGGGLPELARTSVGGFDPQPCSFAGLFASTPCVDGLLAMQKVEGSSPFSRLERKPRNAGLSRSLPSH